MSDLCSTLPGMSWTRGLLAAARGLCPAGDRIRELRRQWCAGAQGRTVGLAGGQGPRRHRRGGAALPRGGQGRARPTSASRCSRTPTTAGTVRLTVRELQLLARRDEGEGGLRPRRRRRLRGRPARRHASAPRPAASRPRPPARHPPGHRPAVRRRRHRRADPWRRRAGREHGATSRRPGPGATPPATDPGDGPHVRAAARARRAWRPRSSIEVTGRRGKAS